MKYRRTYERPPGVTLTVRDFNRALMILQRATMQAGVDARVVHPGLGLTRVTQTKPVTLTAEDFDELTGIMIASAVRCGFRELAAPGTATLLLRMATQAQEQCRRTLETMAELRTARAVFGQQGNAQVNAELASPATSATLRHSPALAASTHPATFATPTTLALEPTGKVAKSQGVGLASATDQTGRLRTQLRPVAMVDGFDQEFADRLPTGEEAEYDTLDDDRLAGLQAC